MRTELQTHLPGNQWDDKCVRDPQLNVGKTERIVSGSIGVCLVANAFRRLSIPGIVGAAIGAALIQRALTGRCKMYEMLGFSTADESDNAPARPEDYFEDGVHVQETFIINRRASELYDFWHKFENLPLFMEHLERVDCLEDNRSHWVAKGPMGVKFEWDAEIFNDEPNKLIAWRSLCNADIDNTGSVRFIEQGDGTTRVTVTMQYIPPAGQAGAWTAKLFGSDPEALIREDMCRFKELMESGQHQVQTTPDVVTT
jgi:uncharacterized membrane protein